MSLRSNARPPWGRPVVTTRPKIALLGLAIITAVLMSGMGMRAPQAGNEVFLSADSDVAENLRRIT